MSGDVHGDEHGYTLLEVIVVVACTGILIVLALMLARLKYKL